MESIAVIFGRRVRSLRKRQKMSQERLAESCDLHPTYIGQIERGEKNASLETIMSLCKGLQVSPAELFKNIGAEGKQTAADAIYEHVLDLSEREQRAVLDIIKSIKSILY